MISTGVHAVLHSAAHQGSKDQWADPVALCLLAQAPTGAESERSRGWSSGRGRPTS
jgi:hypothetical protein